MRRIFTFLYNWNRFEAQSIEEMEPTQRLLRLVQMSMLASIVFLIAVGEIASRSVPPSTTLFYVLTLLSVSTLGAAVVVRRTLIFPCEALLREKPNDTLLLARRRAGYIVLFALCEVLAAFGFVLRMSGFTLSYVWGFYASGFLLIILFSPPPSQ